MVLHNNIARKLGIHNSRGYETDNRRAHHKTEFVHVLDECQNRESQIPNLNYP